MIAKPAQLALVLALAGSAAAAQISPGPLSAPHADLEGSRNCLQCHTQGEGVDANKCLSCHGVLRQRISRGLGLHSQPGYDECRSCHIDHHGREYELVWWGEAGRDTFDHELAGWKLEGAHVDVECRECHAEANIGSAAPLLAAGKQLDRTFLGLTTECRSCHEDEHRGQFEGEGCVTCHTVEAFAPAPLFDHADAAFPLTGSHADVACADCHREEQSAQSETFTRFRPVAHGECSSCHRDPHEGELGGDCSSCHATQSWLTTPGFDHARTRFVLTGRHRNVGCAACHRQGGEMRFSGLPFASCSDCHADPHDARFGPDCSSCHATSGWERIASGAFEHSRTDFPLEGAHRTVDCAACHLPDRPLRIAGFERCSTCHEDEHLGQFAGRTDGGDCSSCHTAEAFSPTTYTARDHLQSRFPLRGLHEAVACADCHLETDFRLRGGGATVRTAKFAFESLACASCHADPHQGAADPWLDRSGLQGAGCAACHSEAGWKQLDFDHSATAFALEGAHLKAPCGDCHATMGDAEARPPDVVPLRLSGLRTECASCHDEPHGGQFDAYAGGCASCHGPEDWARLSFDHGTTDFPLTGAHAGAECASCHQPPTPGGIIPFAGVPTDCEACHAGPSPVALFSG